MYLNIDPNETSEWPHKRVAHRGIESQIRYSLNIIRQGMIRRCYSPKQKLGRNYRERGVIVCPEWLDSIDSFVSDVKALPNWQYKESNPKNWTIDKDLIGTGLCYSSSQCLWLPKVLNKILSSTCLEHIQSGRVWLSINHASYALGKSYGTISNQVQGRATSIAHYRTISSNDPRIVCLVRSMFPWLDIPPR